jgi:hypothetical protein
MEYYVGLDVSLKHPKSSSIETTRAIWSLAPCNRDQTH